MRAAVIYAAKSTKDPKGSIPTQLADCRAMAEREGWDVVGEYEDEAKSAYHGDRGPGLASAREHAARMAAETDGCVLVAQHSDRFARGDGLQAQHLAELWFAVRREGIELRTVQDDSTFTNPLLIMALGERNTEDSRRKGLAVKAGVRRRAERGGFVGGRRPYGYRYEHREEEGRRIDSLVIDQAEAGVLRRILREYVAGRAQNAIARDLQREAVPTLTPRASWYATTIAGMLKNPLYVGMVTHDGEHLPGSHEPIIDRDTWEQASQLREARSSQGRPRGRRTAGRHLLTEGLLRCTCGAVMSPVTKRDKRAANGQGYETYVCVKRLHHGPSVCAATPIKRAVVDGAIYDYFEEVALDLDAMRSTLTEQAARGIADSAALRNQAEREAAKAEEALARVERDYLDGKLSIEKWERLEAKLAEERDAARAQVEQHDRQRDAIEARIASIDAEAEVLKKLVALRRQVAGEIQQAREGDLDELRAVLRRLFVGFELASPRARLGSGVLRGQHWVESERFLPAVSDGWCVIDRLGERDPVECQSEAEAHELAGDLNVDCGPRTLSFEDGYYLLPVLRFEAIDLDRDDPAGFPAVRRLPLSHSFLCTFLADW